MNPTKELASKLGFVRTRTVTNGSCDGLAKRARKSSQQFDYLIVIDFESTCWENGKHRTQEIIEFPAVLLNTVSGNIESEFHHYIQPQESPILSDFCKELTGITQENVDNGIPLSICLHRFSRWLAELSHKNYVVYNVASKTCLQKTCTFVTWSDWDLAVCLQYECRRKQLRKPMELNSWIDLRATYRRFYGRKPQGLNGALQELGVTFEGREHSGLHDARNTARLAWCMMKDGCLLQITRTLTPAVGQMTASIVKHGGNNLNVDPVKQQFTSKQPSPTKYRQESHGDNKQQQPAALPAVIRPPCVSVLGVQNESSDIKQFSEPGAGAVVDPIQGQGQGQASKQRSESSWIHRQLSDDLNVTDDGLNDEEILNFVEQLQVERGQPQQQQQRSPGPYQQQSSTSSGRQMRDITNTTSTSSTCQPSSCEVGKSTSVVIAMNEQCSSNKRQQQQSTSTASVTGVSSVVNVNVNCNSLERAAVYFPCVSKEKQFAAAAGNCQTTSLQSNLNFLTDSFRRPEPARPSVGVCPRNGVSPASSYTQLRTHVGGGTPVRVNLSPLGAAAAAAAAAAASAGVYVKPLAAAVGISGLSGQSGLSTPNVEQNSFRTPVVHGTRSSSSSSAMKSTPPLCDCGCRAKRKIVQSPGPNIGRFFFCCGTSHSASKTGCKFFKWEQTGDTQLTSDRNVSINMQSPLLGTVSAASVTSHVTPISVHPRCFSRSRVLVPPK